MSMTPTQRTIRIEINEALPLMNQWQRWHWRGRGRYIKRLAWAITFRLGRVQPLSVVAIKVTRFSNWRGIAPDKDAVCCKPLLDVLQPSSKRHPYGLGIIADDSREVIRDLVVDVEKGAPRTIVEIEDLSNE